MAFDNKKWNAVATDGSVGGAYLSLAITISPIIAALEKIEAKTGVDLSSERQQLDSLNEEAFSRFKELTGWEPDE